MSSKSKTKPKKQTKEEPVMFVSDSKKNKSKNREGGQSQKMEEPKLFTSSDSNSQSGFISANSKEARELNKQREKELQKAAKKALKMGGAQSTDVKTFVSSNDQEEIKTGGKQQKKEKEKPKEGKGSRGAITKKKGVPKREGSDAQKEAAARNPWIRFCQAIKSYIPQNLLFAEANQKLSEI